MKKKLASLLRKWADRLAPIEADIRLTYEEYEINTIQLKIVLNPKCVDYPYYKEDMACKIGLKMVENRCNIFS